MSITGVGFNRAMKNLAVARQQARLEKKEEERYAQERKDKKLNILLGIKAKYGSGAIASLFPGENIYEAPGIEDVSEEESDESLTSSSLYSQTNKEIVAMEQLRAPESKGGYGLDDETIAKFKANGDSDVFQRILKKVRPIKQDFISKGRDFPSAALQGIVEGAVLANSSPSGKINLTAIEKVIGGKLDDLSKAILLQQEQPRGSIQLGDYFYAEQVDLKSLPQIYQTVISGTVGKAANEIELLNIELAKGNISTSDKNYLTQRKVDIEEALENVENNPTKIISLYGNSFAKDMFNYDKRYQNIPVPESFKSSLFEVPLVANEETAILLLNMGIINEGTILRLPNGNEIDVQYAKAPLPVPRV